MPTVISVKFPYTVRELWFDPGDTEAQEADHVICHVERGLEVGLAVSDAREVTEEELAETIGTSPLREIERVATDEDLERADELARMGDDAMPTFRRLVSESGLDMKPVGVEYLFDGDRAVCYFAAEERVDFRQLVRDLSHELHVRIDMHQIGVREEAALVGGYGHCGQELCCRRFNTSFDPVSIRMAKEQDLPLNSTKISGACGRLMCCLRYEFEAYRDFKSRAPKRNAVITTPLGTGKIVEYDTPKEEVCIRLENGKQIRVALADMTASEAAVKKSEELNCTCRPDTVSREVLDKLESPDVQMALAELDRKNGVTQAPELDEADIFVETQQTRHRSSSNDNDLNKGTEGARKQNNSKQTQRSSSSTSGVSTQVQGQTRRRTRKPSDSSAAAGAATSGAASTQPTGTTSARRRHHQAGESASSSSSAGQTARSSQPQSSVSGSGQTTKRTRHPGDKGGQQNQPQNQSQGQGQNQQLQRSKSQNQQRQGQGQNQGQSNKQRQGQSQNQNQQSQRSKSQNQQRQGQGQSSKQSQSQGQGKQQQNQSQSQGQNKQQGQNQSKQRQNQNQSQSQSQSKQRQNQSQNRNQNQSQGQSQNQQSQRAQNQSNSTSTSVSASSTTRTRRRRHTSSSSSGTSATSSSSASTADTSDSAASSSLGSGAANAAPSSGSASTSSSNESSAVTE